MTIILRVGYTEEEKKIVTNFFLDNSHETHRVIAKLSMGEGGYSLMRSDLFCAAYETSSALGIYETSPLWNPRNELAAKKKASYLEHNYATKVENASQKEIDDYKTIL